MTSLSSDSNWETPKEFFNGVNSIFNFTLDAAASHENRLCDQYFTEEDNGLRQEWTGRVWCNPPYGREMWRWVKKGYTESFKGTLVCMLIPAYTDTGWFHSYILNRAKYVALIEGRLKFNLYGKPYSTARFPNMLVIWAREFESMTRNTEFIWMSRSGEVSVPLSFELAVPESSDAELYIPDKDNLHTLPQ